MKVTDIMVVHITQWEAAHTWETIFTDTDLGTPVHTVTQLDGGSIGETVWQCPEEWGTHARLITDDDNPAPVAWAGSGEPRKFQWPGRLAGRPLTKFVAAAWVRGLDLTTAAARWQVDDDYSQWAWIWCHPGMSTIHTAACVRGVPPLFVLAATLAEVLGQVTPEATLYGKGSDPFPAGSLNSFFALVGDPSAGKSSALGLPSKIIDYGMYGRRAVDGAMSSPAGIARQLDQPDDADDAEDDDKVVPQAIPTQPGGITSGTHTTLAISKQITSGLHMGNTTTTACGGEALPQRLRRVCLAAEFGEKAMKFKTEDWQVCAALWSGESLTDTFGDSKYNRNVPEHTYRWTLAAGIQPVHAVKLLRQTGGGLSQRFVVVPPLTIEAEITHAREAGTSIDDLPKIRLAPEITEHIGAIPIDPAVTAELLQAAEARRSDGRAAMVARMAAEPAHDAHAGLVQLKVAAGISIILGGGLQVTQKAWEIARCVVAISHAHRAEVLGAVGERVRVESVAAETDRQRVIGEAKASALDSQLDRACEEYMKRIRGLGGSGRKSEISVKVPKRVRNGLRGVDIWSELEERGLIAVVPSTTATGRRVEMVYAAESLKSYDGDVSEEDFV